MAEKYRKKIELMVRKPDRSEEPPEDLIECPFCGMQGPEMELQCSSCQSIIPFDIATGKRMALTNWAECPSCSFPCNGMAFMRIVSADLNESRCPMCNDRVDMNQVKTVQDPIGRLRERFAKSNI